ncbi:portal protein [Caudoviricetes sp.]|nr:portal protein [Caudoviricetes sp.]
MALLKDIDLANKHWQRYQSALRRGHQEYQIRAKLCENFYLGGGRQWSDEDKKTLEEMGRPYLEENIIFSTVNTVIGYQTQSRMDIVYKPREADDQGVQDVLSKLAMFITDQNKFPWKESTLFSDGLIQQRGFYDLKMDFNENVYGDISLEVLDPLDVIPDPDSKSYDPDDWADVITLSWMSFEDIKETYGLGVWRKLENTQEDESDFGTASFEEERNKFGTTNNYSSFYTDDSGTKHARIINRQYWKIQNREFYFDPKSGDLFPVPDDIKPSEKKKYAKESGYELIKKVSKRIRWTVSTKDVVLFDEWSPYEHFTVIPYFPYFRRGTTLGLVDNLIKTQEMLNKVFSQILHTVNTTANSGWSVEENSLVNMDVEDLETVGSSTGLVLEYKSGRNPPAKIEPNQVPNGLKDLVTSGIDLIRLISGVSETFQGGKGPEVSGTAIQSRVHQSAIQLAAPIDNLFRTRNMFADRLLKLIQAFYTQERTFLVTGSNEKGETVDSSVTINKDDGLQLINDVTVGKYDSVIADVPTQITFQNAQLSQAIEMRKYGINIPDEEMIRMSTLSRKNEIVKKIENAPTKESQQAQQKQLELQIDTMKKTIEELEAKAKSKEADTLKQVTDVAVLIAANPKLSPLIDALMATVSKGVDKVEEEEVEQQQQQPSQLGMI